MTDISGGSHDDQGGSQVDEVRAAAAERVRGFLAQIERLGPADFERFALEGVDTEGRRAARASASQAAREAGLSRLLENARTEARLAVERSLVGDLYQPTFVGLNWSRSIARPADQAAMAATVEDAASAAVVDGLVSAVIVDRLREPFEFVAAAAPSADDAKRRPDRSDRLGQWIMWAVLGALVISMVLVSQFTGILEVGIPVAMIVVIIWAASRERAR